MFTFLNDAMFLRCNVFQFMFLFIKRQPWFFDDVAFPSKPSMQSFGDVFEKPSPFVFLMMFFKTQNIMLTMLIAHAYASSSSTVYHQQRKKTRLHFRQDLKTPTPSHWVYFVHLQIFLVVIIFLKEVCQYCGKFSNFFGNFTNFFYELDRWLYQTKFPDETLGQVVRCLSFVRVQLVFYFSSPFFILL